MVRTTSRDGRPRRRRRRAAGWRAATTGWPAACSAGRRRPSWPTRRTRRGRGRWWEARRPFLPGVDGVVDAPRSARPAGHRLGDGPQSGPQGPHRGLGCCLGPTRMRLGTRAVQDRRCPMHLLPGSPSPTHAARPRPRARRPRRPDHPRPRRRVERAGRRRRRRRRQDRAAGPRRRARRAARPRRPDGRLGVRDGPALRGPAAVVRVLDGRRRPPARAPARGARSGLRPARRGGRAEPVPRRPRGPRPARRGRPRARAPSWSWPTTPSGWTTSRPARWPSPPGAWTRTAASRSCWRCARSTSASPTCRSSSS